MLVATDLDGTLLRSDHTVSAHTVATFAALRRAGIPVVVVTARPPRYLLPVVAALGLTGVALCANGAMEFDLAAGRVTAVRPVPMPVAVGFATRLGAVHPIGLAIETGERVVYEPAYIRPNRGGDLRVPVASREQLWASATPIVKLLVWSALASSDELLASVDGVAEVSCTHSGATSLLEVSAAGVDKASALAGLCARLGVAAADVVAFGDMPNDLGMLQWAGTGYAVANAHPSLLATGLPTTAANDDDGVALVLESILDRREG